MGMDTPASEAGLSWDRVLQSRELRARLTFTIGALLLWRLLHLVPLPGIDPEVMAATLSRYGMINRGNVIALGLTPFVAVWAFCEWARGSFRDASIDRVRRYATAAIAAFQAYGVASAMESVTGVVAEPGFAFRATAMLTLVAGTMLMLWLGEQITRRGLGDGIWLLVAAESVANLPATIAGVARMMEASRVPHPEWLYIAALVLLALTALIVGVEGARRRVWLTAKGNPNEAMARPLELQLDHVTILPATFATIALSVPALLAAGLFAVLGRVDAIADFVNAFTASRTWLLVITAALIPPLTFLLTAVLCRPRDFAARLERDGAEIEGVPRAETADYLETIILRLTAITAVYLLAVSLLPPLLQWLELAPVFLSGVQLMIVALVALRIIGQVREIAAASAAEVTTHRLMHR